MIENDEEVQMQREELGDHDEADFVIDDKKLAEKVMADNVFAFRSLSETGALMNSKILALKESTTKLRSKGLL